MLEVKNVSKAFMKKIDKSMRISFLADDNISFRVKEGEILGIIGPNGAGKTTLLRMIAGIMEPTSGEVYIDKLDYVHNGIEIKKRIAFLSGNTKLYKDISPMELLKMCGEYYGVSDDVLRKRIDDIVKRFDMEKFVYQRIENLSTGQYQRVSIARCLIHDPKYYILDEATSGLDVVSSKVILDFIKEEKKKGKCIIYSTHYMEEADMICDRILMIDHGRVVAYGTSKDIKTQTKTKNLRDAFFVLSKDSDSGE